jgi:DNA repair protein RadD
MYQLRDYQQDAVNAALDWITKSIEPCLLELATGAGKSLIVASLARAIHQKSGKKILCMAPSKELVEQNGQKYKDYGYDGNTVQVERWVYLSV